MTYALQRRLAGSNITVSSVHPGAVRRRPVDHTTSTNCDPGVVVLFQVKTEVGRGVEDSTLLTYFVGAANLGNAPPSTHTVCATFRQNTQLSRPQSEEHFHPSTVQ